MWSWNVLSKRLSRGTIFLAEWTFDARSCNMFGFYVIDDQSPVTGAVATVLTMIGWTRTRWYLGINNFIQTIKHRARPQILNERKWNIYDRSLWYLWTCLRRASLVEQVLWQREQTTGGWETWLASIWTLIFCLVLQTWRQSTHWYSDPPRTQIFDLITSSTSAHPE